MSSQKFTIAEAKRITGKSRTTILKHINAGDLSAERKRNSKGWTIDASELIRVYGDVCDFDRANTEPKNSNVRSPSSQSSKDASNLMAKELLSREREERERERQLYRSQIDNLQESLSNAQEGLNRATLLLQDQTRRGGDWENAFDSLSQKIANGQDKASLEIRELKEASARREAKLKAALDKERGKSIWRRLIES